MKIHPVEAELLHSNKYGEAYSRSSLYERA